MSHPIAIFHHCRLSAGDPPIDFDWACGILEEQMKALAHAGLLEAASEFYAGVNGGEGDVVAASCILPAKAKLLAHPATARGELPTLHYLQNWLPGHEDWYVLYFHLKGAIHKNELAYVAWRHRMQHVVISNWKQCVLDMDQGIESVGAHWLTPKQYPALVSSPFWGGNFWWAKASFLKTLPPMPETATTRGEFYLAESWIGRGPRPPVVKDYNPGWP